MSCPPFSQDLVLLLCAAPGVGGQEQTSPSAFTVIFPNIVTSRFADPRVIRSYSPPAALINVPPKKRGLPVTLRGWQNASTPEKRSHESLRVVRATGAVRLQHAYGMGLSRL